MTREEFELGIPFKNIKNKDGLQSIFSYVNVKGKRCIQEYHLINNGKPVYHCDVWEIHEHGVEVERYFCGERTVGWVPFANLVAIADMFGKRIAKANKEQEEPLARFTHDCREARIFRVWDDPNMFYFVVIDLQTGHTESGKRCEYYNIETATVAAKKEIGYEG